jgi:hypothetical protein
VISSFWANAEPYEYNLMVTITTVKRLARMETSSVIGAADATDTLMQGKLRFSIN